MKKAVLLVNLGTPDTPEVKDVGIYLKEFLNDPRVIDLPNPKRFLLVNGIIIPARVKNSSKIYKEIWQKDGSPLLLYSKQVQYLLQKELGDEKYKVFLAMRYRKPSLPDVLNEIQKFSWEEIIVFPMFPQYASASTGTAHQLIMEIVKKWQVIPKITFINSYFQHPAFINVWKELGSSYNFKSYDHILFSYHGLPERHILKAEYEAGCLSDNCCSFFTDRNYFCYRAQCFETTRKITTALNIPTSAYTTTFQSRLGKDPWIKPYTDKVLVDMISKGNKRFLVFAPAFVSDCLETIHEIGVEYDELTKEHGAEKVELVPSLNNHPAWINAIKEIIQ